MFVHVPDGKTIDDIKKRVRNVILRYQFVPNGNDRTRDDALKLYSRQCNITVEHINAVLCSKEEPCEALLKSINCRVWTPDPTIYE